MFANYIFAKVTSVAEFAKISSREYFQIHGRHLMVHFSTDMVHYFKDLSIRNTQHTNWQDSLWVMPSRSPAKIGHLVPQ